ncbi:hypothetical protein [Thalassotalea ganghwensis]
METFKASAATFTFVLGLTFVALVFIGHLSVWFLLAGLFSLMVAYYIWPKNRKSERDGYYAVLDIIEALIELPIRLLSWFFGKLVRLFKDVDLGV